MARSEIRVARWQSRIPFHSVRATLTVAQLPSSNLLPPKGSLMTRNPLVLFLAACACCESAVAEEPRHYASVAAFVDSIPGAVKDRVDGDYGELGGPGHRDWAGVVAIHQERPHAIGDAQQVFVLTQTPAGDYVVAAQSAAVGKRFFVIDQARIKKGSVFVASEWSRPDAGAQYVHQFKLYAGQWRLIGARFHFGCAYKDESGDAGGGDQVDLDRNLLTGQAIARYHPSGGNASEQHLNTQAEMILLGGAEIGETLGWSSQFDPLLPC
jgi:hypothetical protein